MKLLSVDDSSVIRKIMRGSAEVLNYDFLEAGNGDEALNILEKEFRDINLVMMDWNMPGMDGLEVLRKMKQDNRYKDIPVMMVTTESEKENIIKAVQEGAINYMIKPFTVEELIKNILECLGEGEEV